MREATYTREGERGTVSNHRDRGREREATRERDGAGSERKKQPSSEEGRGAVSITDERYRVVQRERGKPTRERGER